MPHVVDSKGQPPLESSTHLTAAPPQSRFESYLEVLWAEALGVARIDVRKDFFDLGGDSLSAAAIFSMIQSDLGIDLPLATLLEHPTISSLARCLEGARPRATTPLLVPLRRRGARPPFFCVHGVGGRIVFDRALLAALPDDQPTFSLCIHESDPQRLAALNIEALADAYVGVVRRTQATGPFYLGGPCAGGHLALEMARRLERLGERVALVFLMDSVNLAAYPFWQRLRLHALEVLRVTGRQGWNHLRARVKVNLDEWRWARRGRLPADSRELLVIRRAVRHHVPTPYAGPVWLIVSSAYSRLYGCNDLGWRPLLSRLQVLEAPGSHRNLLHGAGPEMISRLLRQAHEAGR